MIDDNLQYDVTYSLQPTAEKSDIVVRVSGPAVSNQVRGRLRSTLLQTLQDGFALWEESLSNGAAGSDFNDEQQRLIDVYYANIDQCRGGYVEDPETDKACDTMGQAMGQLSELGVCYGREGEASYQYEMHFCGADSN